MRKKGSGLIILLVGVLIVALVVVGYLFFFNKRANIDRAIKSDTTAEKVSAIDKLNPRDEIVEKGYDVKVIISPSVNNTISKNVVINATEASKEAAGVGFFITQEKEGFTQSGMPSIGIDQDPSDGWSLIFDTTEYQNGIYYINTIVYPEGGEGDPLGIAQIQVEIKN